ncbi:ribosomal protein S18-alanine N-acetyltransferase [bacterium]|nr:ribosomal protein S18-alanine N-acetyltransferase [bacterium]
MPDTMKIRPMVNADLARVYEIEQESFPSPWSMKMLEEELLLEHSLSLALEEENTLKAYLFVRTVADEMHIVNLAVDTRERKKGFAALLIKETLARSRATGAKYIFLEVRTTNLAAIRLYEKFGFRILRMRSRYYEDSSDAYEMALVIDDELGEIHDDS